MSKIGKFIGRHKGKIIIGGVIALIGIVAKGLTSGNDDACDGEDIDGEDIVEVDLVN